jgi:signal transduction histidine kinase
VIVLAALDTVAYRFLARSTHELLEPLLALPEGQAAYAAAMARSARTIVLFDIPLLAIVAVAAYLLASFSVRPLLQAREREAQFAADAAHELRTPLATIAGLAQAAHAADAPAQSRALEQIADVALDASGLLGNLLMLARDSPDDVRMHEPVDLAAVLAQAVRAATPTTSVAIVSTVEADGAYVVGEIRALRQLVDNLIANAVRYARSTVEVGVRADRTAIVLWVQDDGPGVADRDRERIFERFFKADPAGVGSGLGLAICRHIAVRHGGTLVLEDRSRFVTRLPRASSA